MTGTKSKPPEEIDFELGHAETALRHMLEDGIMTDEQKIAVMAGEKSINDVRKELALPPLEGWIYDKKLLFEPSGYCPVLSENVIRNTYARILKSEAEDPRGFLEDCREIRERNLIDYFGRADGFCDF